MSTQRFTPEFKEEAVKQVVERGYSVPDVPTEPSTDLRRILGNIG